MSSINTIVVRNYQTAEQGKFVELTDTTTFPAVSVLRTKYPDQSSAFPMNSASPPLSTIEVYPKYALLTYSVNSGVSGESGGTTIPLAVSTNSTLQWFRNTAISNTAIAVKASGGNIYGYTFYNVNNSPVYIKIYDIAQGSVTVGTSTPSLVVAVPAASGAEPGVRIFENKNQPYRYMGSAITIAAVTELGDSGTTAPAQSIYGEIAYK